MYLVIGKEECNRRDMLKNLLYEKGIRYHYLDMLEMPHKNMTYLKMHCSSYTMVLSVNCFSTFNKTLDHFKV